MEGNRARTSVKISLRIHPSLPRTNRQRVNNDTAPSCLGMTDEEPALATHRRRSNVILDEVVVDFEASVVEITKQSLVLVEEVVGRLSQRAFGEQLRLQLLGALFETLPNRRRLLLADAVALGGSQRAPWSSRRYSYRIWAMNHRASAKESCRAC